MIDNLSIEKLKFYRFLQKTFNKIVESTASAGAAVQGPLGRNWRKED